MPHPWTVSRTAAATDRRTDGRVVARLRGAAVALGGGAAARRRRRRPATRSGSGPGAQGVCRRLGRDRGPRRHRRQAHDLVGIAVGRRVHAAVGPGQPATTATTSATAETASGRPRGPTGPTEGLRTAADRGPPRGAAGTREFLTEFLAVSTKLYCRSGPSVLTVQASVHPGELRSARGRILSIIRYSGQAEEELALDTLLATLAYSSPPRNV